MKTFRLLLGLIIAIGFYPMAVSFAQCSSIHIGPTPVLGADTALSCGACGGHCYHMTLDNSSSYALTTFKVDMPNCCWSICVDSEVDGTGIKLPCQWSVTSSSRANGQCQSSPPFFEMTYNAGTCTPQVPVPPGGSIYFTICVGCSGEKVNFTYTVNGVPCSQEIAFPSW